MDSTLDLLLMLLAIAPLFIAGWMVAKHLGTLHAIHDFNLHSHNPMKLTKQEKEAQKIIVTEAMKVVDLLGNHLEQFCDMTKGQSVPIVYIRASIQQFKEGYQKGAGIHATKESSAKVPSEQGSEPESAE